MAPIRRAAGMRTVSPTDRRRAALLWLVTTVLVGLAWHAGEAVGSDAPRADAQAPPVPTR